MEHKFSLFKVEIFVDGSLSTTHFEYVDTFDTIEEAYDNSVHILEETIILPSYGK